jgi:glycosyltransferase involved in cell wall biosynthesis
MINFLIKSKDASEFYRIRQPCRVLNDIGVPARLVGTGGDVPDADTWVINRPDSKHWVNVISGLVELGRRVVVDLDDRFDCVRPGHVMYGVHAEHANECVKVACSKATAVTASTQAIADYYGATVIPNYIPAAYLDITGRHVAPLKVGWAGTVKTHPNDLQITHGQVARAVSTATDAALAYLGPKDDENVVRDALGAHSRIMTAGWLRIDAYPHALAEFDVGIAPLEPCTFNDGKSWLKLLEYAAVGVAPVASPTAPNQLLLDRGCGIQAVHPNEWRRHVSALLASAQLRADVAGKARQVASGLTIEGNIERWADALAPSTARC